MQARISSADDATVLLLGDRVNAVEGVKVPLQDKLAFRTYWVTSNRGNCPPLEPDVAGSWRAEVWRNQTGPNHDSIISVQPKTYRQTRTIFQQTSQIRSFESNGQEPGDIGAVIRMPGATPLLGIPHTECQLRGRCRGVVDVVVSGAKA